MLEVGLRVSPRCDLCEALEITTWYFSDEFCFVAECESCGVPMVVLREHRVDVSDAEREVLFGHLGRIAVTFFHGQEFFIDGLRRQIPDHFHAHARKRPVARYTHTPR